jgi:hypothetical protein
MSVLTVASPSEDPVREVDGLSLGDVGRRTRDIAVLGTWHQQEDSVTR